MWFPRISDVDFLKGESEMDSWNEVSGLSMRFSGWVYLCLGESLRGVNGRFSRGDFFCLGVGEGYGVEEGEDIEEVKGRRK